MDDLVWRPSRSEWAGSDGVVWRRQRRWLSERDAHRLVTRASGVVAVESAATFALTWLPPDERAAYWDIHAAGHIDGDPPATPNARGVTYHVSVWKNRAGDRLVLLSEMC